jgi:hypothetical protein
MSMSIMEQINHIERRFKLLIREWDRYFSGDIRVPPEKERKELERRLRLLTERPSPRRMEQYRLEQLQHRFMTYVQMWERMLREREEGRSRFPVRRPGAPPPPPRPTAGSPNAGASASVKSKGGGLYDRYVAAKQQTGEAVGMDQKAFHDQIAAQKKSLEARLGQKVRFDVLVENGKVKLAARKVEGKKES